MVSWIEMVRAGFTPGAAGVWTGVLMLAGWMVREWRENRKLSDADKQARRQGYEHQVQLLMDENRALAGDQRDLRAEYLEYRKQCQAETEGLHRQNMAQEAEIAQLRRRVSAQDLALAALGAPAPDLARVAAEIDALNTAKSPVK